VNFLADECCDAILVSALRNDGHDVLYVKETAPGADDSTVLHLATAQQRILLTEDKDFGELAFRAAGIDDWERYVKADERFLRPAEVDYLVGDASKARDKLGWKPSVSVPELVEMMVRADLELEGRRTR
jgi:GDP-D-mannose dehydratase